MVWFLNLMMLNIQSLWGRQNSISYLYVVKPSLFSSSPHPLPFQVLWMYAFIFWKKITQGDWSFFLCMGWNYASFVYLFLYQGLIEGINSVLNKRKEVDELDSELTRTDIIKCIQSERVRFRGVNLSGLDLSKLVIFFFSPRCFGSIFYEISLKIHPA